MRKQNRINPFFSIIVINLNNKKGLQKTLKSIFNQKLNKIKIQTILIDGLSHDGSKEIILQYKKKIHSFLIEKDKGIYNAMNKGINFIKGQWVFFLNSNSAKKDF